MAILPQEIKFPFPVVTHDKNLNAMLFITSPTFCSQLVSEYLINEPDRFQNFFPLFVGEEGTLCLS
ncbi:MAG: hypothetical protein R2864_10290 [Syntrophotaleaceae bacterium]